MNTAPKLLEQQARDLLDTALRTYGLHEDAYHVGCGGKLDMHDQAAIDAIIAALAPPSGEGVEIAWPFTYIMSHSGREFVPKDHAERKIREAITTPQSAPVDGVAVGDGKGVHPAFVDMLRKFAENQDGYGRLLKINPADARAILHSLAATTPPPASQERGGDSIVLDAYQLRCAAELAAPDYEQDEDQRGTELIFQSLPERIIEGETLPSGMYCWYADCPEEGVMHLEEYEEYEARMTKVASPPSSAGG